MVAPSRRSLSSSSSCSEYGRKHREVEVPADDRGHRQRPFGLLAQVGHPLGHHLADAGGEPDLVEVDRQAPDAVVALGEDPFLGQVKDHLDDEEGVPPGLPSQGVGQGHTVVGQRVAGGRFHEADDLEVLETDQGETLDCRFAVEPGQKRCQRMGAGQVAVPEGADHGQRHGLRRMGQLPEELEAGRVGPVQIVEHDEKRGLRRGRGQKAHHGLHDHEALGVGLGRR